ncbi:serine/threonine-protein kinase 16-like [Tubulanus polymorphus]|uniref:serine/threonine-protein kinase 16-like n=1 Tax=Tubulanus polymorphus TaxID=672921 RepID=UPI003DA696B2
MNSFSVSLLLRMGCVCAKESITVGNRKFYVRSRLGEGGFSFVDLVEDKHSHKLYALKRVACHSKEDERVSMQEVEIMRTFDHPNLCACEVSSLVAVNDYAKSIISEVLIVMPFYRKGTLQDEIDLMCKKYEHIREDRILRLLRGICEGLREMHHFDPPYAHRDMKPANVLLDDTDQPVLMDFGSAAKARVEIKTSADARKLQDIAAEKCTMPFRPPELFQVQSFTKIDERVDIWSLGCTLYSLAFLESPFEQVYQRGDSLALAAIGGNIKYPNSHIYSEELINLIRCMLVVDLEQRPFIDTVIQHVDNLLIAMENRI